MSITYLAYHFSVEPKELGSEILIAELGEKPFESFMETEFGFSAYIQKEQWFDTILNKRCVCETLCPHIYDI